MVPQQEIVSKVCFLFPCKGLLEKVHLCVLGGVIGGSLIDFFLVFSQTETFFTCL